MWDVRQVCALGGALSRTWAWTAQAAVGEALSPFSASQPYRPCAPRQPARYTVRDHLVTLRRISMLIDGRYLQIREACAPSKCPVAFRINQVPADMPTSGTKRRLDHE